MGQSYAQPRLIKEPAGFEIDCTPLVTPDKTVVYTWGFDGYGYFGYRVSSDGVVTEVDRVDDLFTEPRTFLFERALTVQAPHRVFVGSAEQNRKTDMCWGPRYAGNTVLIELAEPAGRGRRCIFIGRCGLREFVTEAPVKEFVSYIVGASAQYPYAIDEDGNAYLLARDVMLPASALAGLPPGSDPYDAHTPPPRRRRSTFLTRLRSALREPQPSIMPYKPLGLRPIQARK